MQYDGLEIGSYYIQHYPVRKNAKYKYSLQIGLFPIQIDHTFRSQSLFVLFFCIVYLSHIQMCRSYKYIYIYIFKLLRS